MTAAITERWSATASLPYLSASWSLPQPISPPGPRRKQETSGIGDLVIGPRFWVFDPRESPDGNLQVGLGLKCPTGDEAVEERYPDITGANFAMKPADVSIQPGDGGWGSVLDLQAFRDLGPVRLFAGGTYLVNPRETNRTESIVTGLVGPAATADHLRYNSVPDQFLVMAGGSVALGDRLSAGLALRWEGVPPRDLVGGNDGFRRPGYVVALAPGLSWSGDGWSAGLSVPWNFLKNRLDNAQGEPGDATFADWSLILSVTVDF